MFSCFELGGPFILCLSYIYLMFILYLSYNDVLSPPAWGAAKARLGARGQDGANVLKASRVGNLARCVGIFFAPASKL